MSGRKVLFARKPRGISSSESTSKKESVTRIDATYLSNLANARMNRNLSDLLGAVNGVIRIEITKEGHSSSSIVANDGTVLADQADIQKAQFMGSFINNERKDILKSETSQSLNNALAALVVSTRQSEHPITKLPKTFVQNYRGIEAQMKTLAANIEQFEKLDPSGVDLSIKNILIDMGARIRNAAGEYLTDRALQSDEADPIKLNTRLLRSCVPIWFFNRLTAARVPASSSDFSFKSFLFPKDPTKGLSLSFREIRNKALAESLLGLMDNMAFGVAAMTNDKFLRTFMGVDDAVNLDDLADPIAKTLQNVPILIAPPANMMNVDDTLTLLAKEGIRGFAWNVGGSVTPQDNLKFIGTLFKRVNIVAISRAQIKGSLLRAVFPGFVHNKANTELNIYAQLKAAIAGGLKQEWFGSCLTADKFSVRSFRQCMAEVLLDLFGVGVHEYNLYSTITELVKDVDALAAERVCHSVPHGEVNAYIDAWTPHLLVKKQFSGRENEVTPILISVGADELLSSKKKKDREMTVDQVRSVLSPAAKAVIFQVKTQKYVKLALRLDDWFRTFVSVKFQSAVASALAAKLDWFLKQPIKYGHEDRLSFLEAQEFPVGLDEPEAEEEGAPAEAPGEIADEADLKNPDEI